MSLPSTTELLLAWDAARPRSQQQEMGMSSLGSCHRKAGYEAQGYPADDSFEPEGIQPIMGSAIHAAAAAGAALLAPEADAENLEVHFGGLTGHPDLYLDGVVRDIKTLGYSLQLESRRQLGPQRRERWQAHTYGAGLILSGRPVHTIELSYISRDSGDEYLFSEPFSPEAVAEAMAWLKSIRESDVTFLPRDYRPESATCRACPFFERCWESPRQGPASLAVLFLDHPDAALWAGRLEDARARRKQAEQDEADARGALDALRSVQRPGERELVAVPGLGKVIKFSVGRGKQSPDMAQIAVDYRNAGARPPMRQGDPVTRVALIRPPPPN